ncbi:MAG: hypothetical protein RMJ82_15185 [Gemmatales bacterium]|nr:hypothetical protein [Gemmatales bacterium]
MGTGDVATPEGAFFNYELRKPGALGDVWFLPDLALFHEGSPNDHSGVHQWYRWTMWPYDPVTSSDDGHAVCTSTGQWIPSSASKVNESSLNPCQAGFHRSIILGVPTGRREPIITPRIKTELAVSTEAATSPEYPRCDLSSYLAGPSFAILGFGSALSSVRCREASSAYSALHVYIPPEADAISFTVRVDSPGDSDAAIVALDNEPIWVLNGNVAFAGAEFDSGPVPVRGLTGQRVLTIALAGGGERNFSFELKNFTVLLRGVSASPAVLSTAILGPGQLQQGQKGAQLQILVSNNAGAATSAGNVQVELLLPPGLTLVSASGSGWTCTDFRCTRSDPLLPGSSYPPLIVSVDVAQNAQTPQVLLANITGGNSAPAIARESIPIRTVSGTPAGSSPADLAPPATLALPQLAYGGGWQTALYFYNTTAQTLSFPVNFVGNNGRPLAVPMGDAPPASSRVLTLTAGATAALITPNGGELVQGWVETALPPGVGGYAVFRQSVVGRADQEAVVPLAAEVRRMAHFVFDDQKNTTAIAIVNPASQSANVTITAFSPDNLEIGRGVIQLGPRSKTQAVLRDVPGLAAVAGRFGRVQIETSAAAISALALRFGGAAFTTIPVFHGSGDATARVVLPQVAVGGGWSTEIYFSNPTSTRVDFLVSFYSDTGSPMALPIPNSGLQFSFPVSLPPGATIRLPPMAGTSLVQGWAEANLPSGVIGHAVFRQSVYGRADQEAVVPLTRSDARTAEFAFDEVGLSTTMAVLNPSQTPAVVAVTSYGENGAILGTSQLYLPPLSKRAMITREMTGQSGIGGKRGRIRLVIQNGALSVLGFRFGGEAFTSIPISHQ